MSATERLAMPDEASHRQHYSLTFAALAVAGIAFALLQSLVSPALPEIQQDLHTTATAATWILTSYLLSAAIMTPIVGRLGDIHGKERMLVITLCVLCVGTFISAIAHSVELLILGRVVQGFGGAIFPLAFGIIRDEFPRERVATGIALISALLGIGGGLGIVLAGPIVDGLSYHWLFWFPLILVVLATAGTVFFIPESPIKVPGKLNLFGAALLSGWLVALLVAISEGSSWGWGDGRTIGLIAVAAVLLVAWIRVEDRAAEPLIDMSMMRIRGVWTVNAAAFLVGAGMFTSFVLVPQFVEMPESTGYGFGASVTQAGLFLLPSTVMMLLVSPIAGRMADKVGSRIPLILGCVSTMASFVVLAAFHEHRFEIYVASGLLGIGVGLAFASLANLIVEAVGPEQTGAATGMNTVMRSLGGSIGGQVAASILAGGVLAATGMPDEGAFTTAFTLAAVACGAAAIAGLLVPRPERSASGELVLN